MQKNECPALLGGWWHPSLLLAFAHFGGNSEIHLQTFAATSTSTQRLGLFAAG